MGLKVPSNYLYWGYLLQLFFLLTLRRIHIEFTVSFYIISHSNISTSHISLTGAWAGWCMACQPQQMICNWIEKITRCKRAHYNYLATNSFMITQCSIKTFRFLPAQSNFLPFLIVSLLLLSIQSISACSLMTVTNENHHYIHMKLFIHEKILTWRYEKLGCSGIYHIPLVQCSFEVEKIALEATLVSSYDSGPQC